MRSDLSRRRIAKLLADLLGLPASGVSAKPGSRPGEDLVLRAGGHVFRIEIRSSGSAGPVATALDQLRRYRPRAGKKTIPLLVVPFMGEVGRALCEKEGASWLDLSGNAGIEAPGLRVHIRGRPNQFRRAGRPSNPFAAKASRIARQLLVDPLRFISQRELSKKASLDEGYTSKVVRRLERDALIERNSSRELRPRDPTLLLEAWRETYDFNRNRIFKGHIATRSSDELLRHLAARLGRLQLEYAVTGLAAAWLLTRFASFRLVTFYLNSEIDDSLIEEIGLREETSAANTWLVAPNDEGIFQERTFVENVPSVHPVQVYLDLKGHPERASEAAEMLRSQLIEGWSKDAGQAQLG